MSDTPSRPPVRRVQRPLGRGKIWLAMQRAEAERLDRIAEELDARLEAGDPVAQLAVLRAGVGPGSPLADLEN